MQFAPYIRRVPGADTAVLFIHGIVGTPAHFRGLLEAVPDGWSVYNILLEGHGGTPRDFAAASMAGWRAQAARQVDEILESHERLYIVAHSMGTFFAMEQQLRRPERVAGLFLLAVPLTPRVLPGTAWNSLLAALGRAKPGSAAAEMVADCSVRLSPWLPVYLGWIPRYLELFRLCREARDFLPRLGENTRCFQSAKDELVSPKAVALLKGKGLSVAVLPDSGHFAYGREDLALLRRELKDMLT